MGAKVKGFTLIEVLVASVILFATITVISLLYRGALISSEKANSHIQISNVIPIAIKQIKLLIQKQTVRGVNTLAGKNTYWGVSVEWNATAIAHKPAPPLYDFDTNSEKIQPNKYYLWQVEARFSVDKLIKVQHYKEVSWDDS